MSIDDDVGPFGKILSVSIFWRGLWKFHHKTKVSRESAEFSKQKHFALSIGNSPVSKSRYAWVKGDRDTRIRLAPFEPPAFRFLPILNMGVRLLSPRPSVLQAVPKGGRETSRRCWPLKPLRIRDLKSFRCSARCPAPSPKRYRSSLREGTVGMVSSSYDNALSSA
jgi:hypothetical protein